LMSKETIVPEKSVKWLFNFAPIFALASALLLMLYLPFFDTVPLLAGYGDLIVVMYLLLIPALAIVIGGFASGNSYATIGAQRKMIMMMSYEFPLAVLVIGFVWMISKMAPSAIGFSFSTFIHYPIFSMVGWIGGIGVFLLFLVILVSLTAELIKAPFDASEADTELAEGLLVEYSGRNLALFLLTDAVKLTAFGTLIIGLFFPYQLSTFIDLGGFMLLGNVIFFLFKFFIIAFLGLTLERIAFARFKITQITKFFWLISAGISLLGFLLIYIDMVV